jgi:hypothetical protein
MEGNLDIYGYLKLSRTAFSNFRDVVMREDDCRAFFAYSTTAPLVPPLLTVRGYTEVCVFKFPGLPFS